MLHAIETMQFHKRLLFPLVMSTIEFFLQKLSHYQAKASKTTLFANHLCPKNCLIGFNEELEKQM